MKEKTLRNKLIVLAYLKTKSLKKTGKIFKISKTRIRQVFSREMRKSGVSYIYTVDDLIDRNMYNIVLSDTISELKITYGEDCVSNFITSEFLESRVH